MEELKTRSVNTNDKKLDELIGGDVQQLQGHKESSRNSLMWQQLTNNNKYSQNMTRFQT